MPAAPLVVRSPYMKNRVASVLSRSSVPKHLSRSSVLFLGRAHHHHPRQLLGTTPQARIRAASRVGYLHTVAKTRFSTMASATGFYDFKPLDSMQCSSPFFVPKSPFPPASCSDRLHRTLPTPSNN